VLNLEANPLSLSEDEYGPVFNSFEQLQQYTGYLMRADPYKAIYMNDLRILRESVELALKSKNADTADSRIKVAAEAYSRIKSNPHFPSDKLSALTQRYKTDIQQFPTQRYLNVARGYLDKADNVKTEKAKIKYREQAQAVLNEGLLAPDTVKEKIQSILSGIAFP
jgi:hypothetical protein